MRDSVEPVAVNEALDGAAHYVAVLWSAIRGDGDDSAFASSEGRSFPRSKC